MIRELWYALERVARRVRHLRLWGALTLCWLVWALVGVLFTLGAQPLPWLPAAIAALAAATGVFGAGLALRSAQDARTVARRIEAAYPDLGTGLLAAVEEAVARQGEPLGFLQEAVVRQSLEHRREHAAWDAVVPARALRAAKWGHAAALGLLLVSLLVLGRTSREARASGRAAREFDSKSTQVQVDPGNTSLERGTSLLVVAKFAGAVPADASLAVSGGTSRPMTRSLEDPTFAGRVESVDTDLTYRVEYAGRATGTYRVTVFEYPELRRADAKLAFPDYTSLEPKTVEDIRHVTAVEGTSLTLLCRLNKAVAKAELIDEADRKLALTPAKDDPLTYAATTTLADTHRYRVALLDREGRANKQPAEIVVNVTPNRPPVIAVSRPGQDARVSPIEELTLKAKVEDDYGVVRHGISYALGGNEPREVVLKGSDKDARHIEAEHLLDFEALHAQPDELVSYFFWAEDIGPDGRPRRTSGDMFFAEVRPFEEIFRQGEQPSASAEQEMQGQGGAGQQAEQLAELQKQIINGTWKLLRREIGLKPSEQFTPDSTLLRDSQQKAIEQATQLGGQLRDAGSKAHLETATQTMTQAETHFSEAVKTTTVGPLARALSSAQAAYQALLKLRAREYQIVRSNRRQQQGGGRAAGGAGQRQLQQLELTADENRYEERRAAQDRQGNNAQNELRQVVNRLRELAQRQTDLNDRVKELQSALEAAKTAEARAEIERQLKRLRDQQRQILRDADELRERMENEQNRERMAEARERMEQGREQVRQASEALEQGRLPQAVTAGARAGRQLNDLREQLRKDSSDRFSEELTDMRDRARRLDETQDRLTEQLDALNRRPPQGLRDTGERKAVRDGLDQQREQLGGLVDQMRRTVQEAEETEPLLARQLFDTVRKADEQTIPDALEAAKKLADVGIPAEAAKASRHAGKGLEQLREGVERAAESVLGDETAALKRAQDELDQLGEQVDRELAQATGQPQRPPSQRRDARGGPQQGDPPPQGQEGQAQPQDPRGQQRGDGNRQADQPQSKRGGGSLRGGATPPTGQDPQQQGQGQGGQRNANQMLEGLNAGGPGGPILGEEFRRWTDRMRDVEDLLQDPDLRAETARIRDRVRGAREEFKRHAKMPDWTQLQSLVAEPLRELRQRVAEEVRRRESPDSLVPIDRDPVPPQFTEGVKRYYERLGSGR
jgi:hypothetical protein